MTDIEEQALALLNEGRKVEGLHAIDEREARNCHPVSWPIAVVATEKLNAEREAHEAYKREVSDAVERFGKSIFVDPMKDDDFAEHLSRFILPKPDPLVEALEEWINSRDLDDAASFRAAIEKRGGKIVWGEG